MGDVIEIDDLRQVTFGFEDHEHPVFSPDGKRLAYYAGTFGHINLFVTDIGGHNTRPLTAAKGNHTQPHWAPDGAWIYYRAQHDPGTPWSIWRVLVEDPAVKECLLSDPVAHFKHPAVSPDGTTLLWFSDAGSPGNFHLWRAPLTAGVLGAREQLTYDPERNDCHPTFSPDGEWITFHAYMGRSEASVSHICVCKKDGSEVRRLTSTDEFHKHPFFVGRDLIIHHTEEPGGRRYVALRSVKDGALVAKLTSGKKNDKHPHPFVPARGPVRIAFASKKRGAAFDGEEGSTYDIFWGVLSGIRVRR